MKIRFIYVGIYC